MKNGLLKYITVICYDVFLLTLNSVITWGLPLLVKVQLQRAKFTLISLVRLRFITRH